MLHFLRGGPCVEAAEALEREAQAMGLLPPLVDHEGTGRCWGWDLGPRGATRWWPESGRS